MFNLDEWLVSEIADKFARMENTAFVTGDGVNKPKGFLTYADGVPNAARFDVIEQIPSGAEGDVLSRSGALDILQPYRRLGGK